MIELRDRERIRAWLRRDAGVHVYALADLDPGFWPHTRWFASEDASGELDALLLILDEGLSIPIVYVIAPPEDRAHLALLLEVETQLPKRFFANFAMGLDEALLVLAGNERRVRRLDQARAEKGDDPADWLPAYLASARERR